MMPRRPVLTALRRYAVPALALAGLATGLAAQYLLKTPDAARLILLVTLLVGGLPVVMGTVYGMLRRRFAADIVATLAIVGAAVTGEYLAGCVIVLMQTGGEALEAYAVRRASAPLVSWLRRSCGVAPGSTVACRHHHRPVVPDTCGRTTAMYACSTTAVGRLQASPYDTLNYV